jgi:hypothetical protein
MSVSTNESAKTSEGASFHSELLGVLADVFFDDPFRSELLDVFTVSGCIPRSSRNTSANISNNSLRKEAPLAVLADS